jgi:hypothetical protein
MQQGRTNTTLLPLHSTCSNKHAALALLRVPVKYHSTVTNALIRDARTTDDLKSNYVIDTTD